MCKYPFDDPVWSELASSRHRDKRQLAKKKWGRSLLAAETFKRKSKYDPHLEQDEIRRFEMACVLDEASRDGELLPTECNVRKFYRRFQSFIGASNGQKTEYIMVIYQANGTVHGFPVTKQYLRDLGVNLS